jgi:hypothetical protein
MRIIMNEYAKAMLPKAWKTLQIFCVFDITPMATPVSDPCEFPFSRSTVYVE